MRKKLLDIVEAVISSLLFVPIIVLTCGLIGSVGSVLYCSGIPMEHISFPLMAVIPALLVGMMLWNKKGLQLYLPLLAAFGIVALFFGGMNSVFYAGIGVYLGFLLGQNLKWSFISFERGTSSVSTPAFLICVVVLVLFASMLSVFIFPKSHHYDTMGQNPAVAKEAASMINGSFMMHTQKQKLNTKTGSLDLVAFINYVNIDTTSTYLAKKETPLQPCSKQLPCLKLHNGGILQYDANQKFSDITAQNALFFNLDPDGMGPRGRVSFYQYADGRLTTGATKLKSTQLAQHDLTSQDTDPTYIEWN